MGKKSNRGFTLIELLAVLVVLIIILAIAIPWVTGILKSSRKSSFESDAKMVLQAVKYKQLSNDGFNPLLVTKENMQVQLGISSEQYEQVKFGFDDELNLILVGSGKWAGFTACGTIRNMIVVEQISECGADMVPPVLKVSGNTTVNAYEGKIYVDEGATAIDGVEGDLSSQIEVTGNINYNVAGTYEITYFVTDSSGNVATAWRTVNIVPVIYTFDYVGNYQPFTAIIAGNYQIELWGARGGYGRQNDTNVYLYGKGAYTGGDIHLEKGDIIYLYVGGAGGTPVAHAYPGGTGGYNGGAAGGADANHDADPDAGGGGGGSTDVRLVNGIWNNFNSLKSRIMVAAGGGGSCYSGIGGDSGALTGISGYGAKTLPTQVSGYAFGYGMTGITESTGSGGGGGGYYGGYTATGISGGGGSSFVSGCTDCNAIASSSVLGAITHTGQPNHYSNYVFANATMIAGNMEMPSTNDSTEIGHSGNGYARIIAIDGYDTDPTLAINGNSTMTLSVGSTYIEEGAMSFDKKDGDITSNIIMEGSVNSDVIGIYKITYTITDSWGNTVTAMRTVNVEAIVSNYGYTGGSQTFTAPTKGNYKIELWGARGGYGRQNDANVYLYGRGAYTSGVIDLQAGTNLYVYIGGVGGTPAANAFPGGTAGYNGGAAGGADTNHDSDPDAGGGGGGSTDVRLVSGTWNNFDSLKSRIMVAAGGGGSYYSGIGGDGGALTGISGYGAKTLPTQTSGHAFGYGMTGIPQTSGSGGGGGGYYGGYTVTYTGGGGGSSFVSGCNNCNAIDETSISTSITHTGQSIHYSGYTFSDITMIAGNAVMPNAAGGTQTGNAGNGYVRISYIGEVDDPPTLAIVGDRSTIMVAQATYVDAGATAFDEKDKDITSKVITTGTVNPNVSGTYIVTYSVMDSDNNIVATSRTIKVIPVISTFSYSGAYQEYVVPETATYKIELWGAQGNSVAGGAYTSGEIVLSKYTDLYIYIGQGKATTSNGTSFNGGTGNSGGTAGGGATDLRLVSGVWNNFDSLKSRIMVAAGSGSGTGNSTINLGYGGTLVGGSGGGTAGGTQTAPGARQTTTYTLSGFGYASGGCSGGGGYYGGGAAGCVNGAGGGSSFVSGYIGCDAISEASTSAAIVHTGDAAHYSGKIFTNATMIAGNGTMPNITGGTEIGHTGNGYAIITYLHD